MLLMIKDLQKASTRGLIIAAAEFSDQTFHAVNILLKNRDHLPDLFKGVSIAATRLSCSIAILGEPVPAPFILIWTVPAIKDFHDPE